MEYSTLIIQRIRYFCDKKGISINKLAEISNVKQSTLDHIMQGVTKNPGIQTLHKVANALNMTIAEFLNFEELNDFSFEE